MDIRLIPPLFIFNREKEQETQKEEHLMEEKKKKERAQKKVWLEFLVHCSCSPSVSLRYHSHYDTEVQFITFEIRYAWSRVLET